jgi:F-type H+-transporting ATPase subunit b
MHFRRILFVCATLLISLPAPLKAMAEETAPHEGGSAMPQLDPTYYASQLFWLVICGTVLYLVMSKIALPRVSRVLASRDNQVRHDLEKAARLKQEAEDIKVVYTRALRDADERAKSLNDRTIAALREKQNAALANGMVKVNERLAKTEHTIAIQKDMVMNEVEAIAQKLSATIVNELKKAA